MISPFAQQHLPPLTRSAIHQKIALRDSVLLHRCALFRIRIFFIDKILDVIANFIILRLNPGNGIRIVR